MSREARAQLSILGTFTLVMAVIGFTLWAPYASQPVASATIGLAPEFVISKITVGAPSSGSQIQVVVAPESFEPGTADGDTLVRIKNVTTGAIGTFKNHHMSKNVTHKIVAKQGDQISILAINQGSPGGTDLEDLGFIGPPSDNAPPDLDEADFNPAFNGTTFSLSGPTQCIYDNSFPVTIILQGPAGSTTTTVAGNGSWNTATISSSSTSISASDGDRILVTFQDDVGNQSDLVFIASQSPPAFTYSSPGFHAMSPSQAESETAGTAGLIEVGDGNSHVTVYGQDLIHRLPLVTVNAPILGLGVELTYRSGIAQPAGSEPVYDGNVGAGFDWNLDARIEYNAGDLYWYPGDGRRIGPFPYDRKESGYRVYDSPPGVYLQLRSDSNGYALVSATGQQWNFDPQSGLLVSYEDYYAANGSPDPGLNRVALTRNDDNRVVRATLGNNQLVTFGWFTHGRLATVRHYDRVTGLSYAASGALTTVEYANGSEHALDYSVAVPTLLTGVQEVSSPNNVPVLGCSYSQFNGLYRVTETRNRHNAQTGNATTLVASAGAVTVTDPANAVSIYEHSMVVPYELTAIQRNTELTDRTGSSYPGSTPDPLSWRHEFTIDPSNYGRTEEKLVTQDVGGSTTTDWHRWAFRSPAHATDARLRGRVSQHDLVDPDSSTNPSTAKFDESWSYGAGDDFWPSEHEDFDGVLTYFTYNAAGQTLRRFSETVNMPNPASLSYVIETRFDYDDYGRLEFITSPDRAANPSPGLAAVPSTKRTYHTTGVGRGYLARTESQEAALVNPDTTSWTEFDYDVFGNVSAQRSPHRLGTSGVATVAFGYDELNRQTSSSGPDVTLTPVGDPVGSGTQVAPESATVYSSDGFRVVETRQRHWLEDGTQGPGGSDNEFIVTSYTHDASGRVIRVESDLATDGVTVERSKSEVDYSSRGLVTAERQFIDGVNYAEVTHSHDAAGNVLSTTRDPDGNDDDGDGVDEIPHVTWLRYDGLNRTLERFEQETGSGSYRTVYDDYGRVVESVTPPARLSGDPLVTTTGEYRTIEIYSDSQGDTFRSSGTQKQFSDDGGVNWTTIAETLFGSAQHDKAGRRHSTLTWYKNDSGGNKSYSVAAVDRFAGGEAQKTYVPFNSGTADWSNYELAIHDSFDRLETRITYASNIATQASVMIYDDANGAQTGWVVEMQEATHDEADSWATTVRRTLYEHDEQGRLVRSLSYGTLDPASNDPVRIQHTQYSGMGQAHVRQASNGDLTEWGVSTQVWFDLAGRKVEERRGLLGGGIGEVATTLWSYDLLGQTLVRSLVEDPSDPPPSGHSEDTEYYYDELGRVTRVVQGGAQVLTTEIDYGFVSGLPSETRFDGIGYVRRESNELGHPLVERVLPNSNYAASGVDDRIEWAYNNQGACGCMAQGTPSTVTTFVGGVLQTEVDREYSPRGEVLTETLFVQGPITSKTTIASFEFDAAGRKTSITYPVRPVNDPAPPPPEPATVVEYEYRGDGRVHAMKVNPAGLGSKTLVDYQYDGSRESSRVQWAYNVGALSPSRFVAHTSTSADELGRSTRKEYDLFTDDGHGNFEASAGLPWSGQAMGWPDFETTIQERDVDGRVLAVDLPPYRTSGNGPYNSEYVSGPQLSAAYDTLGQFRTEEYVHFDPQPPSVEKRYEREYYRSYNRLDSMIETWTPLEVASSGNCTPPNPATGEYVQICAENGFGRVWSGLRPMGPDSLRANYDKADLLASAWYYHLDLNDGVGRTVLERDYYTLRAQCPCAAEVRQSTAVVHRFYYVQRGYSRDAWGRIVEEAYSRVRLGVGGGGAPDQTGMPNQFSSGAAITSDDPDLIPNVAECGVAGLGSVQDTFAKAWPTEVSVYDGFGRLVFSSRQMSPDDLNADGELEFVSPGPLLGLFHSYDGLRVLSSGGGGGDGSNMDASAGEHGSLMEAYLNPSTGLADKRYIFRDGIAPGPGQQNPWDTGQGGSLSGGAFSSPLYNLFGSAILDNATPATGNALESPFSAYSVPLSVSGYQFALLDDQLAKTEFGQTLVPDDNWYEDFAHWLVAAYDDFWTTAGEVFGPCGCFRFQLRVKFLTTGSFLRKKGNVAIAEWPFVKTGSPLGPVGVDYSSPRFVKVALPKNTSRVYSAVQQQGRDFSKRGVTNKGGEVTNPEAMCAAANYDVRASIDNPANDSPTPGIVPAGATRSFGFPGHGNEATYSHPIASDWLLGALQGTGGKVEYLASWSSDGTPVTCLSVELSRGEKDFPGLQPITPNGDGLSQTPRSEVRWLYPPHE